MIRPMEARDKAPVLGLVRATGFFTEPEVGVAEEISVLMVVWLIFAGAGLVQKKNDHVAITYVFDLFSAKWRRVTLLFGNVCILAVLVIHLVSGFHLIKLQMKSLMISVDIPMGLFAIAVLLGMATMFVYTIDLILKQMKRVP